MTHPNHSPKPVASSITELELTGHLIRAEIPIEEWGRGAAKTVGHLLHEIRTGESSFSVNHDGTIERKVGVVWVDVLHLATDGIVYALREARQEYADGRIRRRTKIPASLGEKMTPTELPETAAYRAITEELGIEEPETIYFLQAEQTTHTPDTYPGLETAYQTYQYVATIDSESFDPDGYLEVQSDKTNYYEWTIVRLPTQPS